MDGLHPGAEFERMGVPTRYKFALLNGGVKTVRQIVDLGWRRIFEIRNIGKGAAQKLVIDAKAFLGLADDDEEREAVFLALLNAAEGALHGRYQSLSGPQRQKRWASLSEAISGARTALGLPNAKCPCCNRALRKRDV